MLSHRDGGDDGGLCQDIAQVPRRHEDRNRQTQNHRQNQKDEERAHPQEQQREGQPPQPLTGLLR